MTTTAQKGRGMRAVVDLILLVGIAWFSFQIVHAGMRFANKKAEIRLVTHEARALFDGLERYYERNHGYPGVTAGRVFDHETLDPLRRRGYYRGHLTSRLVGGRVDAYDSPDDGGKNQEFWIEMTLAIDPSLRVLVVKSDDAPLGGGRWREGVFLMRDGSLEPL